MVEESNSYEMVSEEGFSKIRGLCKLIRKDGKLFSLFDEKEVKEIQHFYNPCTFFVKDNYGCSHEQIINRALILDPRSNAYLSSNVSIQDNNFKFPDSYAQSISFFKVKFVGENKNAS